MIWKGSLWPICLARKILFWNRYKYKYVRTEIQELIWKGRFSPIYISTEKLSLWKYVQIQEFIWKSSLWPIYLAQKGIIIGFFPRQIEICTHRNTIIDPQWYFLTHLGWTLINVNKTIKFCSSLLCTSTNIAWYFCHVTKKSAKLLAYFWQYCCYVTFLVTCFGQSDGLKHLGCQCPWYAI